jgi:hypothetical protein
VESTTGVIEMGRVTAKVREKVDYVCLQTRVRYIRPPALVPEAVSLLIGVFSRFR